MGGLPYSVPTHDVVKCIGQRDLYFMEKVPDTSDGVGDVLFLRGSTLQKCVQVSYHVF